MVDQNHGGATASTTNTVCEMYSKSTLDGVPIKPSNQTRVFSYYSLLMIFFSLLFSPCMQYTVVCTLSEATFTKNLVLPRRLL